MKVLKCPQCESKNVTINTQEMLGRYYDQEFKYKIISHTCRDCQFEDEFTDESDQNYLKAYNDAKKHYKAK